jgi:hypothetical protein
VSPVPTWRVSPWTAAQRGVLIAMLCAILIVAIVQWLMNPRYVSDPQPELPARAVELEDRIDPNTAEWNLLAAMPNIGEKRARDIVAYRQRFLADHPGQIAFTKPADLLRIRGVGPGMLAQIEPYLIFPKVHARPTTVGP